MRMCVICCLHAVFPCVLAGHMQAPHTSGRSDVCCFRQVISGQRAIFLVDTGTTHTMTRQRTRTPASWAQSSCPSAAPPAPMAPLSTLTGAPFMHNFLYRKPLLSPAVVGTCIGAHRCAHASQGHICFHITVRSRVNTLCNSMQSLYGFINGHR